MTCKHCAESAGSHEMWSCLPQEMAVREKASTSSAHLRSFLVELVLQHAELRLKLRLQLMDLQHILDEHECGEPRVAGASLSTLS